MLRPAALWAISGAAAISLWTSAAFQAPAANPVPLAEIQTLARLSEAEQGRAANQERILTWFLANVERHRVGRDSVAARALRTEMGPQSWPVQDALVQRLVPRPFGTGSYSLLFSPTRRDPATIVNTLTGNTWW